MEDRCNLKAGFCCHSWDCLDASATSESCLQVRQSISLESERCFFNGDPLFGHKGSKDVTIVHSFRSCDHLQMLAAKRSKLPTDWNIPTFFICVCNSRGLNPLVELVKQSVKLSWNIIKWSCSIHVCVAVSFCACLSIFSSNASWLIFP